MTEMVESPSLLAYTHLPSGVTTRPCGPAGMGMVLIIWLVAESITATALSLNRPTYSFGAGDCAAAIGVLKLAVTSTGAKTAASVASQVTGRMQTENGKRKRETG